MQCDDDDDDDALLRRRVKLGLCAPFLAPSRSTHRSLAEPNQKIKQQFPKMQKQPKIAKKCPKMATTEKVHK